MYLQPLENALTPQPFSLIGDAESALTQLAPAGGAPATDAISRMVPPLSPSMTGLGGNALQTALFPIPALLQQLLAALQALLGQGQGYGAGGGQYGGYAGGGPEQYFANASGASSGDPHLSFNGSHWNSMASQPNLLDSQSIPGGFRISTQVGAPNERGATYNQTATVTLDNGATTVSMNAAGQATIDRYGQPLTIEPGQTIGLGDGARVTCNANGSLSVLARNQEGGSIETTLTAQGPGVNVGVNAQNVELGGALVEGGENHWPPPMYGGPIPAPSPGPIGGPIPTPIPFPNPPGIIPTPPIHLAGPPQHMTPF